MAELTEEERAKLPDSAFADPEHRAYPIHDEVHAKAALARVKQHGTKEEQKKVANKVHERYPQINLGTYFMALLGLAIVGAIVGTWIKDSQGHYHFVKNTPTNGAPREMFAHHVPTRANVPPRNAAQAKPPHAPRPPLHATRQGNILYIRNVGLARNMPMGRMMGGGFGGFRR